MARYPSGIHGTLPGDDIDDPRIRLTQMLLTIDEHPIADTAPCMNPECVQPVDYLGHGGIALYCSHACRSRASAMRLRARQQVDLIERTLEDTWHKKGVPREELEARARKLRAWLTRLELPSDVEGGD